MDETISAKKEKRAQLEKLNVPVHPYSFNKQKTIAQTREMMDKKVETAGRIMSIRAHGKVVFMDLQDSTENIQVMVRESEVDDNKFSWLKTLVDRGDYLGVIGSIVTTKTGETTILATDFEFLSKALRPLPTAWNTAESKEARFRKRYLDMLINPESKRILDARWLIEKEMRRFLQDEHDFVEVETPILQPLYGGTNATPFSTHMNALDTDFYLRIAPELYLKRLIVGGYDKVFEIARNFRNEGIDQTHQPEFTMVEWYETYADYHKMMDVAEDLVKHLVKKLYGELKIKVGEKEIDISIKWERLRMEEALKKFVNIDFNSLSDDEVQELLKKNNLKLKTQYSRGKALFELFDNLVTPHLIDPIWIIDYPRDISPLSKQHRKNPELAERFEAYIGGKELADGWSEIVDPIDQRNIFEKEQKNMRQGDTEAHPLDEDFIEAMEHGMPPLGGIGMGIDRLVMFLTNTWSIKEVIAFPTMKPLTARIEKETLSNNILTGIEGIDNAVISKFPEMAYAQVIIKNVEIKKSNKNLEKRKAEIIEQFQDITTEKIGEMNSIQAYRKLFKETGTDWHKKRPSPEALLRRISQGKSLYNINTAIDAYNLAVVETGIGLGGFDADKLDLPVSLRFAADGEEMLLLGDDKVTTTKKGQLIYSDAKKPITIDLNYRDINQTKLTKKTTNIALYADGGPGISESEVLDALKKGAKYIMEFCGGNMGDITLYNQNGKKNIESSTPNSKPTNAVSNNTVELPTRDKSAELLKKYIKDESLINHSEMVALSMQAYAKKLGENEELWYHTGLLHDLDWEMFPDEHPKKALSEWLRDYPQEMLDAIAAHAPGRTGKSPQSTLDKYLFACDEICGFMNAVSIMRPTAYEGMKPKSIKKKLKTKAFAANVSREDITQGLELIDKSADEHFSFLIEVFNSK